jgi:hypothetical protein
MQLCYVQVPVYRKKLEHKCVTRRVCSMMSDSEGCSVI